MVEAGEVREEQGGEGLGAIDEGEEGVYAKDLRRAEMIRGEAWESGTVPDDAEAVEGGEGVVADFMEEVERRVFQGKAEGKHAGVVESRRFGEARKRLGLKLPAGLHLFLSCKKGHSGEYLQISSDGLGRGARYSARIADDLLGIAEHLEHAFAIAGLAGLAENPFAVLIGESIEVLVEEGLEAAEEGLDGFIREAIAMIGWSARNSWSEKGHWEAQWQEERWKPGFRSWMQKRVRQTIRLPGIDRLRWAVLARPGQGTQHRGVLRGHTEGRLAHPGNTDGSLAMIATFLSWKRGCLVQNAVGVPSFFF